MLMVYEILSTQVDIHRCIKTSKSSAHAPFYAVVPQSPLSLSKDQLLHMEVVRFDMGIRVTM